MDRRAPRRQVGDGVATAGRPCRRSARPTRRRSRPPGSCSPLDDDTSEFHERFARDRLIGPSARALVGYRPTRRATVAHAVVRALAGQLVEARRALAIERAIARACGDPVVTQDALAPALAARRCGALGLAQHRATRLARLAATLEFERLHDYPTDVVRARLERERGVGPWSIGVIAMEGLGRYDHAIVGDLSLIKLQASLTGRWVEGHETAELLAPYEEWQGLAGRGPPAAAGRAGSSPARRSISRGSPGGERAALHRFPHGGRRATHRRFSAPGGSASR